MKLMQDYTHWYLLLSNHTEDQGQGERCSAASKPGLVWADEIMHWLLLSKLHSSYHQAKYVFHQVGMVRGRAEPSPGLMAHMHFFKKKSQEKAASVWDHK